jgi:hypothetical protein
VACGGWKPKTCTAHGGVDPTDRITGNAADDLPGLIEEKDLVGGVTEGSGVVRCGVSMTWPKLRSEFVRRRCNFCEQA